MSITTAEMQPDPVMAAAAPRPVAAVEVAAVAAAAVAAVAAVALAITSRGPCFFKGTWHIVYAGDFNSWRGRADDAPQKVLAARAYDDAFDPALVYGSLPFLTSSSGTSRTPAISPNWAGHLDRVFVPPGVHVASWKVDYRLRAGRYVAPMASDHNPVVVQLRLPG